MKRKGFTLAEMLIALAVLAILTAVSAPVLTKKSKMAAQSNRIQTPIGSIVLYTGLAIPDGWLVCDGRRVMQPKYLKLREILGKDTLPVISAVGLSDSGDSSLGSSQEEMMAQMSAMMNDNEGKSREEMLQDIAEKYAKEQKNVPKDKRAASEAVWIIKAE